MLNRMAFVWLCALPVLAMDVELETLMERGDLQESVRKHSSERVLLGESTAVGQAEVRVRSGSGYDLELRPRATDKKAGLALRIYMPDRWGKENLREQLSLVAESEQLRVAALEWGELIQVYRHFCAYRMGQAQLVLFDQEFQTLEIGLRAADLGVERNQFTVADRAKLYTLYLDLLNSCGKVQEDLLDTEKELRLLLGHEANLEKMAQAAVVSMPPQESLGELMRQALRNRADYRQLDVQSRSLSVAEREARAVDGFHFKYIQPAYNLDYTGGENSWDISASFVLPWGSKNADVALYQQRQELSRSMMNLKQFAIEARLRVLLKSAEDHAAQADHQLSQTQPVLLQLKKDLAHLDTGHLAQLRELAMIRKRMLDVSLQTAKTIFRQELIAVDLAEEIGSF